MGIKRCLACGDPFPLRTQSPDQSYCSAPECQRQRRKLWQRKNRQTDDDYRQNQARAQRKWLDSQPDYWQRYRAEHPDYTQRNREQQRVRSGAQRVSMIAKVDASKPALALASGTYRLSAIAPKSVAKMDAWIVEITVLIPVSVQDEPNCGMLLDMINARSTLWQDRALWTKGLWSMPRVWRLGHKRLRTYDAPKQSCCPRC